MPIWRGICIFLLSVAGTLATLNILRFLVELTKH